MATLTVNPRTYSSYVPRLNSLALAPSACASDLCSLPVWPPVSPAPSLPQTHVNDPVTPFHGKSRAARNTSVNKASRKRRKRGRPKTHWTKQVARQRKFNPDRLRRIEVINLFAADRFASKIGLRPTSFITLRWSLTAGGEARINKRLSALLNAFRGWAKRQGIELAHIWVHENPDRGEPAFNTHLLANIPDTLRVAAAHWLMKWLGGAAGAIDMQPRRCPGWNKPDDRVSYMCKGTDRATAIKFRLIRKHGWDFAQGKVEFQRSGTSRNINAKARWAANFSDSDEFCDQYRAREGMAA